MAWTETDIPAQTGRVAVVTGANGGLGLETTKDLAAKGAHVIMAARNQSKAGEAFDEIKKEHPDASVEIRELDLGSLDSVETFADSVLADFDRLDLLINNAGVMGIPERKTEDGFEMQFGVNHLGHYALTARLLPLLVATQGSRVVTVTSTARHFGRPVDPENPHLEGKYTEWGAYGQSKLANLHFAIGLQQRLETAGAPVVSLVAHPGLSNTDLQSHSVRATGGGASQRFFEWLAGHTGMSPDRGALPQLRAATDPAARGGQLYAPRYGNSGAAVRRPLVGRSHNQTAIDALFAVSEKETGLPLDVNAAMAESRS
jgi:NAD(P)-dependent dehydrogenase (short-subunit alcohol dehydrogenase family)